MGLIHNPAGIAAEQALQFLTPTVARTEEEETFPWFGIRTRSNYEKIAATVLDNKGFEQYLPTYKSRRRWSDRVVETNQPLFPGYVFCRFDPKNRLPVLTTPGVVAIVGCGNDPAPISDEEIVAVQMILVSELASSPCPFLSEGQRIRVVRGALTGVEGILLKKKSSWRLVVSVSMLQRSISVEIDRDWVKTI